MYEHNGINRIRDDEVDDEDEVQVDYEDQDDEVHQRHQ
jgi:hypothetical protein